MIRHGREADADLLAAMHEELFPDGPWQGDFWRHAIQNPAYLILLSAEEAPTGLAAFRIAADEAEVLTIGVLPASRGRNIGSALLRDGLLRLHARGVTRLFLEVAAENHAAKHLYRSTGFEEVGRRRGYYGRGADALLLARPVTAPNGAEEKS